MNFNTKYKAYQNYKKSCNTNNRVETELQIVQNYKKCVEVSGDGQRLAQGFFLSCILIYITI
jgi:hypothetical protein